jgi:hypothetical protein
VPVIPTEDNYCDWLVGGVKRYFDDRGLRAWSFSIGQVKENEFPFDRAFAVGNKVMGFQVKRPSSTGPQWTWEIDFGSIQHVKVAKTKWILYALPDFADFDRQDVALPLHVRVGRPRRRLIPHGRQLHAVGTRRGQSLNARSEAVSTHTGGALTSSLKNSTMIRTQYS